MWVWVWCCDSVTVQCPSYIWLMSVLQSWNKITNDCTHLRRCLRLGMTLSSFEHELLYVHCEEIKLCSHLPFEKFLNIFQRIFGHRLFVKAQTHNYRQYQCTATMFLSFLVDWLHGWHYTNKRVEDYFTKDSFILCRWINRWALEVFWDFFL